MEQVNRLAYEDKINSGRMKELLAVGAVLEGWHEYLQGLLNKHADEDILSLLVGS
tara:strand:+ start:164 stop:328 length:165 start_codon:yes stop_codon:yes gene_type:complete